jgi:hypothetical protein
MARASHPGQTVKVEPKNQWRSKLERNAMIVIEDQSLERLEIKRLIGFPGEKVRLLEGDLWIDERRFQKSIAQFIELMIPVSRWREIERVHRFIPGQPVDESIFHSQSLWPRQDEQPTPHPSPILDEYFSNAAESRELMAVSDIGLELRLGEKKPATAIIEIDLWISNATRTIQIELSCDGLLARGLRGLKAVSSDLSFDWLTDDERTPSIIVAAVDGRMLVGTRRFAGEMEFDDTPSMASESGCSITRPIGLRVQKGSLSVMQALIVRDIHYRGPNGEIAFDFPQVRGVHVLGDNVSNSFDSRQRWPDGLALDSIVGRVSQH